MAQAAKEAEKGKAASQQAPVARSKEERAKLLEEMWEESTRPGLAEMKRKHLDKRFRREAARVTFGYADEDEDDADKKEG